MVKNLIGVAEISLGVAWMLSSAAVFIYKTYVEGAIFMAMGFACILLLKVLEYVFIEHMDGKAGRR